MNTLRWMALASAALALGTLAGCGEREQVVVYKQGAYQGKPDQLPWQNATLAYGDAKWTQGNEQSWADSVKARTRNQNEYVHIVHH